MQKKTVNRIVNIVVCVILVLVFVVALSILLSAGKGYTSVFGTAMIAVESNSMDGPKPDGINEKMPDGFAKGDLIFVKVLNSNEKSKLEKGQIITYYIMASELLKSQGTPTDQIPAEAYNTRVLNSHRISQEPWMQDGLAQYRTKGDNTETNRDEDDYTVPETAVVGVVTGHVGAIGNVFLFFRSSTGFLVCVVIPSILIVVYCAYKVFVNLHEHNKEKLVGEKERIKEELLRELREKGELGAEAGVVLPDQTAGDGSGETAEAGAPGDVSKESAEDVREEPQAERPKADGKSADQSDK